MKLCVALDLPSLEENLKLAKELNGLNLWLKVGLRSYLRDGAAGLEAIKKAGNFRIFLDLKLHDIPNTMADAAQVCAGLGVDMINLHASAGAGAMEDVMNRLAKSSFRPLVLGVSALTSFSEDEFFQIYNTSIDEAVINMSKMAFECGLDGMVCSAFESAKIKQAIDEPFITLSPGIRPFSTPNDDQRRVADIDFAIRAACDFIVVGRPIYKADNPKEVASKILERIKF